ncbi:MAG: HEAT repeat domain-containing protein [Deltaproteobacteria bacterium]|nr:HEAT repeat domain-containing protein [Deltaproteobacteria bacterium]
MAEPTASPETRREVLRTMRALDEGTLVFAFDGLGDVDPSVRREAVRLVARSAPTPGLLLTLERALTDERELARRSAAMDALAAMGKPAVPLLARLAADSRAGVRRLAVDALGMAKLPDAIDILERAARDPQPAVRAAALEALARTGSARAAGALVRTVEDRHEQATVALAALLGLLQLERLPSTGALHRLTGDALTAPAAFRLLGRAGEASILVDALLANRASRQRAAVIGLADAHAAGATRPVRLASAEVLAVLRELVGNADVQVACAALSCAAWAGDHDVLALAAARDDRAHLASAAHRAAMLLRADAPELAARLRALVADDAPGSDLLIELAEALERAREHAAPSVAADPTLDDRSFARLARVFEHAAGFSVTDDARQRLQARLLPRLEATRAATFSDYVDLLQTPRGKDELQRALELVTVHETYFFRERPQLDAFRHEVLPALLARGGPIRVWSAGTSTGEEAYTLAILCDDAGARSYEVLGTDLSNQVLETARHGRYPPKSFRAEIERSVRHRWFTYELSGVSVHPELKLHTRFEARNLVDPRALADLGTFDVIFCRNVLIYLAASGRARVIESFYEHLRPGGLLFLGHSESLFTLETRFRAQPMARVLAYQRPEDDA